MEEMEMKLNSNMTGYLLPGQNWKIPVGLLVLNFCHLKILNTSDRIL
jgi:hypothetical protein